MAFLLILATCLLRAKGRLTSFCSPEFGCWCCRMKEGQKDIFYMAADSLDAASSAPFVERLVQKDFEVSHCSPASLS